MRNQINCKIRARLGYKSSALTKLLIIYWRKFAMKELELYTKRLQGRKNCSNNKVYSLLKVTLLPQTTRCVIRHDRIFLLKQFMIIIQRE